jgi:hypothetical protein
VDQITIEARFDAIETRLTALEANAGIGPPRLLALVPATAAIGDPSFTLKVLGSNFKADSVIVFAGQDEPTTLVSPNQVTTGVDMSVWLGADPAIPVKVRGGDGDESNVLTFAFTEAGSGSTTAALESRIAALERFEQRIADLDVEPKHAKRR